MNETSTPLENARAGGAQRLLRIALPVGILALGAGLTVHLVNSKNPPQQRPAAERAAIVEVLALAPVRTPVMIDAAGTVIPREAVPLQARVSGEVAALSPRFVPGGRFAAGEVMLEIDPADYRLAVTNSLAALARAEANLAIERGLQDLALHEWETMRTLDAAAGYTANDKELALRTPHLRLAESAVLSARAAHDRAVLDLERTRVRAPFNAVIRERLVNLGTQAGTQTVLAHLAGTDAYWITATLPADLLRWVALPDEASGEAGAGTRVLSVAGADPSATWAGRVTQLLPDLEPRGRQAQLLVEVGAPRAAAAGGADLPLGAFVRVAIEGPTLADVFEVPRTALRDGGFVWLMNGEDRLEIRAVAPVWTDRARALVRDGLNAGERLVVSDVSTPLAGMSLRLPPDAGAARADPPQSQGARDE